LLKLRTRLRGTPVITAHQHVGSKARHRPWSTGTAIHTHAPCT